MKVHVSRTLSETVIESPTRPGPQELILLDVHGPVEIRGAMVDGQQAWILTEPPPTASAPGVDIGPLIADELWAVLNQSSLRARMATIDRQELVVTATTALVARLAQAGVR